MTKFKIKTGENKTLQVLNLYSTTAVNWSCKIQRQHSAVVFRRTPAREFRAQITYKKFTSAELLLMVGILHLSYNYPLLTVPDIGWHCSARLRNKFICCRRNNVLPFVVFTKRNIQPLSELDITQIHCQFTSGKKKHNIWQICK